MYWCIRKEMVLSRWASSLTSPRACVHEDSNLLSHGTVFRVQSRHKYCFMQCNSIWSILVHHLTLSGWVSLHRILINVTGWLVDHVSKTVSWHCFLETPTLDFVWLYSFSNTLLEQAVLRLVKDETGHHPEIKSTHLNSLLHWQTSLISYFAN